MHFNKQLSKKLKALWYITYSVIFSKKYLTEIL